MITSIQSQDTLAVVSLEEAMEHSRIEDRYDEIVVRGCLDAAHSTVEQRLNRKFGKTRLIAVQEEHKTKVRLPYAPLISVEGITALDSNEVEVTLVEGTDYRVDLVRNMVILNGDSTPNYTEFNIDYCCGYTSVDSVPNAIQQAIKMVFANFYEFREDALVGAPIYKVPDTASRIINNFKDPNFV